MTKGSKITFIEINFDERDGIVYARSPELPGLHVCGKSRRALERDIPAVIERLYQLNHGMDVVVQAAADPTFQPIKGKSAVDRRYWATPAVARELAVA